MSNNFEIAVGDCLSVLRNVADNSVDAVVTDPPYGLSSIPDIAEVLRHWLAGNDYVHTGGGFMGKTWDSFVPGPSIWREVFRVLKPGGHALVFAGSRTVDLMGISLRLAEFEPRDCLQWLYGTGFPKSLNLGDGLGTALKPAYEPIILVRKHLDGTVATTVQKWGTGAINIDECRISTVDNLNGGAYSGGQRTAVTGDNRTAKAAGMYGEEGRLSPSEYAQPSGRWPANVILDEEAGEILDEQSGEKTGCHSSSAKAIRKRPTEGVAFAMDQGRLYEDNGGASRFFYCAKTSASEREAGLEHLPKKSAGELTDRVDGTDGLKSPRAGAGRTSNGRANAHPTVKPISLMRYLCRLITPPGGLVLDPFAGSGSTGCAAMMEGFRFGGIEKEPEYATIATARISHWEKVAASDRKDLDEKNNGSVEVSTVEKETEIATYSLTEKEEENVNGKVDEKEQVEEINLAALFNKQGEIDMAWLPAGMATEVAKSEAITRGNRANEGDYIFMHLKSSYEKTQKGHAIIIEHRVVQATKTNPNVEPNPPGSTVTYFLPDYGDAKIMLGPNLKSYVCGLLGADPKNVSQDLVRETVDALGNGLARGMYIHGTTFTTKKKNSDEDFTGFNWKPVPGENTLDSPSVLARKAELEKEFPSSPVSLGTSAAQAPAASQQSWSPPAQTQQFAPTPPSTTFAPTPPAIDPLAGWTENPNDRNWVYRVIPGINGQNSTEQKLKSELLAR